MLLHIFRLEAKAPPKRPVNKGPGRKSRGACSRRVEDIIGKGFAFGGKNAVYVADGTLAVRSFASSLKVSPG